MSLLSSPSDILSYIMLFLRNIDNERICRTCKSLLEHGKNYGYTTFLKSDLNTSTMDFFRRFRQHSATIKTVEIKHVDNPHLWLPHFVENLIFDHCDITEYFNPGNKAYVTKKLILKDYNRYKYKTTVRINWECFPNLEELELYVYDVNMEGIDVCKKLHTKKINTLKVRTFANASVIS